MVHISDFLSAAEVKDFSSKSNDKATLLVANNWLIIFLAFFFVSIFPNVLTIVMAVFLIGGRQLGLAILMHEAGHGILFETDKLNNRIGQWLCAYPMLADVHAYAATHRQHHRLAGSDKDPDLPNYQSYPVEKASFRRKIIRDLTGQTGIKLLSGILLSSNDRMLSTEQTKTHLLGGLLANAVLAFIAINLFSIWIYLIWWLAYLTTYPLFARLRQVAEHGSVEDLYDPDPRKHTRTTVPNILEQLFVCPNNVNYHCEHHFIPTVPCYRLKELHASLQEKGFYRHHPNALEIGYRNVIARAVINN